jgi:hypothetical protein
MYFQDRITPQCGQKLLVKAKSESVIMPGAMALSSPSPILTLKHSIKSERLGIEGHQVSAEPRRCGMKIEIVPQWF